jgi:hypothetical protein
MHEQTTSFDPSLFPRTYQSSLGYRIFLSSLGALLATASLLGLWYFGTGHESLNKHGTLIMVVVCLAFFLLGAYLVVAMLQCKIILTAEATEVYEPFLTKRLLRSQIAGWRILSTQYVSVLEFTPRDPHAKRLKVAMTFTPDAAFGSWLSTLPNLDAQDREESLAELDTNQELGLTHEQRAERLATAANYAKYLTWVTWAASAWGWFYPRPYTAAILVLAALPLAAIFLGSRAKGVFQFDGRRNDARPSLALPMMMPGFILALRGITDLSFLSWQQLVAPILFVAVALTAAIASADPVITRKRWPLLAIFFVALFYGGGVSALADALLDRSAPQIYQTTVFRKHVSTRRRTTQYLRLAPWGPQPFPSEVRVTARFYSSVEPGQTVCVYYHPGALKIPWYVVTYCPAAPTAAELH